jgi:hypothetical protein
MVPMRKSSLRFVRHFFHPILFSLSSFSNFFFLSCFCDRYAYFLQSERHRNQQTNPVSLPKRHRKDPPNGRTLTSPGCRHRTFRSRRLFHHRWTTAQARPTRADGDRQLIMFRIGLDCWIGFVFSSFGCSRDHRSDCPPLCCSCKCSSDVCLELQISIEVDEMMYICKDIMDEI